jgi:S1-C subfamily serine protease
MIHPVWPFHGERRAAGYTEVYAIREISTQIGAFRPGIAGATRAILLATDDKTSQQHSVSPTDREVNSGSGRGARVFLRKHYSSIRLLILVLIAVASGFGALFIFNLTQPPPQHLTQSDIDRAVAQALSTPTPTPSFESEVYQIVAPSVVSVVVTIPKADGTTGSGLGSGVVVDDSGTILTCLHVVQGASDIEVDFADGTKSTAQVVSTQPENDLAVLEPAVIPDNLTAATLASASTLNVGDQVAAIGSPFGLAESLSSGVVSGLGREFTSAESGQTLTNLIQFDAAVNPGNSGGPLVDRSGEVVGIVTGLLNPTQSTFFVGIGFAVPIETASTALGPPWW